MHPNNRHIQTHNFAGFISFAEVGGGGGLIEEKPSDDVRNAATTSYSGDIVNHYTWQGRKLGKKLYSDQGTLTLDETYYDELTLNFGQPTRLLHADGYVDVSAQVPVFYYHLKDHLGNVRLVITPAGSSNQPEIVQAMEYYPFGMRFESSIPYESDHNHMPNKHTYNSNEEQEMPGRWLDYGFRFYDSQIARFHSVDPLAHSFSSQSPYVYAGNNPILNIDFMGLSAMSNVSNKRTSSFTLEMTDEDFIKATRPIGLEGVESKEKKKKTDKNTESQTSQQNGNGKKKKDGKGNVAQGGGGGNWATATLAFIAADIAIPEPTDAAWPKWVGYGIAGTAAAAYLHYAGKGNANYPGPWSYTYQHPSQNPIHNPPNGFDPKETPPGLGTAAKWLIGGRLVYEMYDEYHQRMNQIGVQPYVVPSDNTNVVQPQFTPYRPR